MKSNAVLLLAPLLLGACANTGATNPPPSDAITYARIGETVTVDGPKVTPLEVLEDSRCPAEVDCVWAGQVKLRIRVTLGNGSREQDIISRSPINVADGKLELVDISPARSNKNGIKSADYRFGFRFAGGF